MPSGNEAGNGGNHEGAEAVPLRGDGGRFRRQHERQANQMTYKKLYLYLVGQVDEALKRLENQDPVGTQVVLLRALEQAEDWATESDPSDEETA